MIELFLSQIFILIGISVMIAALSSILLFSFYDIVIGLLS
jgi:hypothetical protein